MAFIKKDLQELSAEISSMSIAVHWASEVSVANLSTEPSSPLNEIRKSDVGNSVRHKFPLFKWKDQNTETDNLQIITKTDLNSKFKLRFCFSEVLSSGASECTHSEPVKTVPGTNISGSRNIIFPSPSPYIPKIPVGFKPLYIIIKSYNEVTWYRLRPFFFALSEKYA